MYLDDLRNYGVEALCNNNDILAPIADGQFHEDRDKVKINKYFYFHCKLTVRNPKTIATHVRIYVHGLCDRNMGFLPASNRHYGITPRGVHVLPVCSWQPFYSMFTNRRKVEFTRSCPLFLASFGKLRLSDQVQFIHRLAWNTKANYMDFLP